MSDHHRYYKDSYGSASSKRYHSPSDPPRMGLSSTDYYDSADSRSKRSRTDSYGAHTSSSRYADYSAGSTSSSGRYKTASSSSSYYDLPGYKPSVSSSATSSKYVDDYKGSGSSSRSAPKSNVRRVPPPLTPPSLSSKSSSSLRLQPLMKVSLSSSSSGVGSSSGKDYYGSRMRQAPPEHHYSYSGSHSSSSYGKSDFKRPLSYGSSSKALPSSSSVYHSTSRVHGGNNAANYRSSATASRRLLARSRAPPSGGVGSRMKPRSSLMSSRRDDEIRRRKMASARRNDFKSRSESRGSDRSEKSSSKEKKEETEKSQEREQKDTQDGDVLDYSNNVDGQIVVEDVAGDDDEEDDGAPSGKVNSSMDSSSVNNDETQKDSQSHADGKSDGNVEKADGATDEGGDAKAPATRALLKLHCPYCDVRCISFREFTFHLRSPGHSRTMQTVVSDFKRKLLKIRQEMKEDQRKREKEEKVLSDTSSFCRVCELNFRTDPKEHESNEIHNKIKALIYRRCDVCDIDFRIWKVHIYHMAALEHAKRVAMKELQEREATGDNVKGTNLSPQELGLDLVEIRTVFYCNACIRYIPIKGEEEEAKRNHCMTLNHLKGVEEFNEREKRRAQREEARERAKRRKQEEHDKEEKSKEANTSVETDKTTEGNDQDRNTTTEAEADNNSNINVEVGGVVIKQEPIDKKDDDTEKTNETLNTCSDSQKNQLEDTKGTGETTGEGQENNQNEAEEDDDDEIELHAGEDVVEDESVDAGDWSRRTRSSQRGDGPSK